MNGEIRVVDDVPQAFARSVLEAYASRAGERFCIALSGGSSGRPCYEELSRAAEERIDWRLVDVIWGDERCVDFDDEMWNFRLPKEALVDRLPREPIVDPRDCRDGASNYENILRGLGGIDLIHLGVGPDGHTASLFPESPAFLAPGARL